MNIIIKIAIISFTYILASLLLKSYRPEFVFLLKVFVVIILFFLVADYVSVFLNEVLSIFSIFNIDSKHINLLIKVVAITIVTDFIADTLVDNGESSIANTITVVSKLIVLYLSLPLIKGLILLCLKFI